MQDRAPQRVFGFRTSPAVFRLEMISKALRNAGEAIAAYAEALAQDGRTLPAPRSLSALRDDPEVAPDLREHIVALVAVPAETIHAAE